MTSRERSPRHHRRKRLLIYRPSPEDDCLKTPPPTGHNMNSPRGFLSTLQRASPMERERRRILSVELRDIAHEVEHLQVQTPPSERTLGSDDSSELSRGSPPTMCKQQAVTQPPAVLPLPKDDPSLTLPACPTALMPPAVLPVPKDDPSLTLPACPPALMPPPLSPPKEESGWGLLPLFHSVRCKLESFAEIFLTPVKSQRGGQISEDGEKNQQVCSVPEESPWGTAQPYTPSPEKRDPDHCGLDDVSSATLCGNGREEDNASPPQLQRTPSQSPLCRPPLQRHLSCPLLPLTQHKWRHSVDTAEYSTELCTCRRRRHSVDTAEYSTEPCTCRRRRHSVDTAEYSTEPCTCRRRRHSVGSVEECRSMMPYFLSCLRKENHPSVLKQSAYQAGDVRKSPSGFHPSTPVHSEGSPAGLCLDKDIEQGCGGTEDQVKESLPDSDFKTPENCSRSKENKVSTIQIRKRVLRQEGNLTPLGLPKRVRLQKEDFSLEEIYTNKNYHTPTEKRKFETIFEEPIVKGGELILTSQRPLRRIMVFKEGGSAPRKRKKKGKAAGRTRRWTAASAEKNVNYELLLQHKLNQLEAALQEESADV